MDQEVQVGVQRVVKRRKSSKEDTADRKYACSTCGKAFKHKHHRTEHERLHTGEKPYHCEWCGKRFAHSGSYSQHRNQAWCKNAEGRDREKKKTKGKTTEVEKRKAYIKPEVKVLKARQVDQAEVNTPHVAISTEAVKLETPSKQPYPVAISHVTEQTYHHRLPTDTNDQSYPNQSIQQSFQQVANETKDMSFQQIAKYFQVENGGQSSVPQEFAQSAENSAWLVENAANMQNMLDIHLNSMSLPEQALGTSSNVQYLYTVPGDQTTYCLSGIPYVNKVTEVQNLETEDTERDTLSGDGSQSAYECFNIFNVQPTTEGGSSSKDSQPKQSNPENYNIFNVQRKTNVDKSLEDQALESSTAVSNLLGYATATSQSTVQGSHDTKPVVTTESQDNSEQTTAQQMQRYSSEVEKEAVKTEDIQGQSISAKVDSLKAIPAILPTNQVLLSDRLQQSVPFPVTNVIQCVLCHEECADTNALVEHIRNKHYYQVAGQLSAASHTEALQEKKPSSNDGFTMTS